MEIKAVVFCPRQYDFSHYCAVLSDTGYIS